MVWIANENIDIYKKGEMVPDEKALLWKEMYVVSPCTFVEEVVQSSKEESVQEVKSEVSKKRKKVI
jgi:hypothetical protein